MLDKRLRRPATGRGVIETLEQRRLLAATLGVNDVANPTERDYFVMEFTCGGCIVTLLGGSERRPDETETLPDENLPEGPDEVPPQRPEDGPVPKISSVEPSDTPADEGADVDVDDIDDVVDEIVANDDSAEMPW